MMPSGTPISSEMATATIISDIVWVDSNHTPRIPMAARQPTQTSATLRPAARYAMRAVAMKMPGQPRKSRTSCVQRTSASSRSVIGCRIEENTQLVDR